MASGKRRGLIEPIQRLYNTQSGVGKSLEERVTRMAGPSAFAADAERLYQPALVLMKYKVLRNNISYVSRPTN